MDCQHELETQVVHLAAFLRNELGYGAGGAGRLPRQMEEHATMIASIDATLRGSGDELGLIGWVMVLRRTWTALVALLGMALGYVANDAVNAIDGRQHQGQAIRGEQHAISRSDS